MTARGGSGHWRTGHTAGSPRRAADPRHHAGRRRGDQPVVDRLQPLPGVAGAVDRDHRAGVDGRLGGRCAGRVPSQLRIDRVGRRMVIAPGWWPGWSRLLGLIAAGPAGDRALRLPVPPATRACRWSFAVHGRAQRAVPSQRAVRHAVRDPELHQHRRGHAGGRGRRTDRDALGLDPAGSGTYRIILVIMALLAAAGLATVALLSDDRPKTLLRDSDCAASESRPRSRPILAAPGRGWGSPSATGRGAKLLFPGCSSPSEPGR